MNKWLMCTVVMSALLAAPLSAAVNLRCDMAGWDSNVPIAAPKLPAGAQWTYIVAEDVPQTLLRFSAQRANENGFEIDGLPPMREKSDTYTEINPRRTGEKITIRFPVKVGDTWQDHFSEPGIYANEDEEYYYDYTEESDNRAAAIETIEVAAGRFKTLRIDRVAHWVKSNPQSVRSSFARTYSAPSASEVQVAGITLTQIWYSPDLGRAVLKAQLRLGDTFYEQDKDNLLRYANSAITELRAYHQGSIACANKPVLLARWPESYLPIGYPARSADEWERAFELRPHRARGER